MSQYVATFHTHVSALISSRTLTALCTSLRMAPVPRKLSSSCGTCLFYTADEAMLDKLDADVERVYQVEKDGCYTLVYTNE
jgi:hypothetical protein